MNIGERVKIIRKEHLKMTQAEFSERINISRSGIANIETDKVSLTDRTISDICREFNVNESWLRTGDGPVFRPALTIDNELAMEVADLINSDDEFTKKFVLQYLRLSDESKEMVKKFLVSVVGDDKNE